MAILAELERRGLIRRARSPADRRCNMLVITPAGNRTLAALYAKVRPIEDPIRATLSPAEFEQMIPMRDALFSSRIGQARAALQAIPARDASASQRAGMIALLDRAITALAATGDHAPPADPACDGE